MGSKRSKSRERSKRSKSRERRNRSKSKERKRSKSNERKRSKSPDKPEDDKVAPHKGSEQENVIDSTNDVSRTKSKGMRSDAERYRTPSPVRRKEKALEKEKSLSPGTKEIRAYWAEQEEKKRKKKLKKDKEKEQEQEQAEEIDMFSDQPVKVEKERHASGSSVDSIEKLRLQALETLKNRTQ